MRKLLLGAVGAALLVALLLTGTSYKGADIAHAAAGTVNYDVDPLTTGNDANHLGTVEACVRFDKAGGGFDGVSDYNIDVVVFGDTQAPDYYDSNLNYDQSLVHVAAPGTDRDIKMPDPGTPPYCQSDTLPDSNGTFMSACSYLDGVSAGTAGNGTMVRVGLDIDGTKSGVVTFTFNPYPLTDYHSAGGDHPVVLGSGQLAINTDCPTTATDDTIGMYAPDGTWFLRNSNDGGVANLTFSYGAGISGGVPVVGDWDGNGTDTIGIYAPDGTWFLRNDNSGGAADLTFSYGAGITDGVPLVGDWDGDGEDSIGIFRASDGLWFLRNTNSGGAADLTFDYGAGVGGVPVVGDWDADVESTVGIFRASDGLWFLRNSNDGGVADLTFSYGAGISGGAAVVGDWDAAID